MNERILYSQNDPFQGLTEVQKKYSTANRLKQKGYDKRHNNNYSLFFIEIINTRHFTISRQMQLLVHFPTPVHKHNVVYLKQPGY